jgi:hypothetical protein
VVPMIPHYTDGVLYNIFIQKNKEIGPTYDVYSDGVAGINLGDNQPEAHGALNAGDAANTRKLVDAAEAVRRRKVVIPGTMRVRCLLPGIPYAILFGYETKPMETWSSIFEEAASISDRGATLLIPAIGTNNKVTFWKSAVSTFHAVRTCLKSPNSAIHAMQEVRSIAPFDENGTMGSSRVILHIQRLMHENEYGDRCVACVEHGVDTMLACGHRILCSACAEEIKKHNTGCPICCVKFTEEQKNLCLIISDVTHNVAIQCCANNGQRLRKIHLPCGCIGACCAQCVAVTDRKCPACKADVKACWDYVPYP